MSFQDVGLGRMKPAGVVRAGVGMNGTGSRPLSGGGAPPRTGGVGFGAGGRAVAGIQNSARGGASGIGASSDASGERDPQTARLSDYLMQYSQNVTIMHRLVQSLGAARDTPELRSQYRCQRDVVTDLAGRVEAELRLQAQGLEDKTRQDAARLRATHTKLSKDYGRVNGIARELMAEAAKRIDEADRHRRAQAALEDDAAAAAAQHGGALASEDSERLLQMQMQEEAINQAIIEETEEELRSINRSLYKVNEIYRDLANIVAQQQEQVEHIEVTTEAAHQRAQQGLQQVQKANSSQSSCTVS
ncbi:unnamed protein product [Phaeothamnion confervicola]